MTATIDLAGIWQGILTNLPGIITVLLALLPSLINGLTDYPNLATGLGKFQSVLGLLSVVVHKDSPGTFKVPLTHSPPPEVIGSSIGPVAIKGPANTGFADLGLIFAWAVLMGAALVLLGSCAFTQHVKDAAVQCSKEELVKLEENGAADVTNILLAGASGWQAELSSIASKIGEDAVGCIVTKLMSGWTKSGAALSPAAQRAHQYLSAQTQTFVL
jgi:hypothetical protein